MLAGVEVRAARTEDLEAILQLERETPTAPHWGVEVYGGILDIGEESIPQGLKPAFPPTESAKAEASACLEAKTTGKADNNDSLRRCLLVAKVGRNVVGFAVGKAIGDQGELESVAVAAHVQRMGVGRMLCVAAMDWCRAHAASAMELEVRAGSERAIRLYAGLGFVEVGRRRGYYRAPVEEAVLLRCNL